MLKMLPFSLRTVDRQLSRVGGRARRVGGQTREIAAVTELQMINDEGA